MPTEVMHSMSSTKAPLLSLRPVDFSLTDGTSIPAPRPETPPERLTGELTSHDRGPLSSHPIAPVVPPSTRASSRTAAAPQSNGHNISDEAPPPTARSRRRPSFAERFLRMRSSSAMRSSKGSLGGYADSTTSLAQDDRPFTSSVAEDEPTRGVKRPAAPSIHTLNSSISPDSSQDLAAGRQSLPKMMRKKSTEWFGTARRMSGMWSGSDFTEEQTKSQSIMEEEEPKDPAPTLPKLDRLGVGINGGKLGGEELFQHIGKDYQYPK